MKQLICFGLLLSAYTAHGQTAQPAAPQPAATTPVRPTSASGLDQGWAFDETPPPPQVDAQGGYLRFKISIDASGEMVAVEKVAGNMSARQVEVCRQHILERFSVRKTRPDAAAATGFFTFRFKVE